MDDCKEFLLTDMVVLLSWGETFAVKGDWAANLHEHRPHANATSITDDLKRAEPLFAGQVRQAPEQYIEHV